jgi:hypothetical protein
MIVISKLENKRLIKGHRYEVQNLWNSGTNQRWVEGKVHLVGFGRYSVDSFTDDNGNPLPKINYSSNIIQANISIKFEDCKEGEILICNTDQYKTLTKGAMYKIQSLKSVEFDVNGFNNKYTRVEKSIKFEGFNRYLKFNGWSFRKLTPVESREISLSSILNGEEPNIIKTKDIRGIDLSLNKYKSLMEIISKTILDNNKHHLSIIDWSCKKTGDKLKIIPEDFNELLNMTLSEILEKLENT